VIELYSCQLGPIDAPRWVIRTNKGLYWDGKSWTPYEDEALLFNDSDETARVINELMKSLYKTMPVWKYKAEVAVEVFGFIKPELKDIQEHLWDTQTLNLDLTTSGPKSTIVLSALLWDTLKEERP
jgi:hypothetical protein